jgi:hypothetical protein
MVRIVIDTDGDKAAATPQGEAAAQATPESPTPPAEVLAAAAALGARDAGPAPSFAGRETGVPPVPSATPEAGAPGAVPEAQSAGTAPGTRHEPQPTVITEDDE